jgi:phosphonoacetate hydrolase
MDTTETAIAFDASATPHGDLTAAVTTADHLVRVEGIAQRLKENHFSFTSAFGTTTWKRDPSSHPMQYERISATGFDLLEDGGTDRLLEFTHEVTFATRTDRSTPASEHGRPYAYESIGQLFDDPKVPDLLLIPAAGFPLHGAMGNHGALTSVQSRGVLLAKGPGIVDRGWIEEHARMVDVAPTVLCALGATAVEATNGVGATRSSAHLQKQDGHVIAGLLNGANSEEAPAKHAVVIVFDGCNVNLLADVIARGEAPAVGSFLSDGAGLRHGIISSFPTVTLPNHAAAFTGLHPGHSGVINNEFLSHDGRHVNLLRLEEMIKTCDWLRDDVETIHEAVHRFFPNAFTTSAYEYIDRGADLSNFADNRAGLQTQLPRESQCAPTASPIGWDAEDIEVQKTYRFMTRVDESCIAMAIEHWRNPIDTGHPLPTLQVVNLNLTDSAGHSVGPHQPAARAAIIDSDRRLQRLVDAISAAGALNDTVFFLISDHGMEQCDPSLIDHPTADLSETWSVFGRREIGDVFLYPKP